MSRDTGESDLLYEALHEAGARPEISLTVSGDIHEGDIGRLITPNIDYPVAIHIGSKPFNAYVIGCHLLRHSPLKPLAKQEASMPSDADLVTQNVINLVNHSVTRRGQGNHRFTSLAPLGEMDMPMKIESELTIALGHDAIKRDENYRGRKNELYLDDAGNTAFIVGDLETRAAILTAEKAAWNGIEFFKGVLFNLNRRRDTRGVELDEAWTAYSLRQISSLAPLRPSTFAYPPSERRRVFTPAEYDLLPEHEQADFLSWNMSIDELLAPLPGAERRAEAAEQLGKLLLRSNR